LLGPTINIAYLNWSRYNEFAAENSLKLKKAMRTKRQDKQFECEADLIENGFAFVHVPGVRGGMQRVLVRVEVGDHMNGTGTLLDVPLNPKFKLGSVIRYRAEGSIRYPVFVNRVHARNKGYILKKEMAADIQAALMAIRLLVDRVQFVS